LSRLPGTENNGKACGLCLSSENDSWMGLDLSRDRALRSKAAVRCEVQEKRQLVRRTGPSGRKMLRRQPLPSNLVKRRLW